MSVQRSYQQPPQHQVLPAAREGPAKYDIRNVKKMIEDDHLQGLHTVISGKDFAETELQLLTDIKHGGKYPVFLLTTTANKPVVVSVSGVLYDEIFVNKNNKKPELMIDVSGNGHVLYGCKQMTDFMQAKVNELFPGVVVKNPVYNGTTLTAAWRQSYGKLLPIKLVMNGFEADFEFGETPKLARALTSSPSANVDIYFWAWLMRDGDEVKAGIKAYVEKIEIK